MKRREFIKAGVVAMGSSILNSPLAMKIDTRQPNIILISIDDLNNYIGPLGGYPGVLTPNINRLVKLGTIFDQAYCSAPFCGASRLAMMTGVHNLTLNNGEKDAFLKSSFQDFKEQHQLNNNLEIKSLAHILRENGYITWGGGKLFHGGVGDTPTINSMRDRDYDRFAWHEYHNILFDSVDPNFRNGNSDKLGSMERNFSAAYDAASNNERGIPDRRLAMWATHKIINAARNPQPYFLGVGFYRPHMKWIVPQRYFDLYPLSKIVVPDTAVEAEDLLDIPAYAHRHIVSKDQLRLSRANESRKGRGDLDSYRHHSADEAIRQSTLTGQAKAIQAYLASITFVDDCVGQLIDAINAMKNRSYRRTVVLLWSDHGWHLGEKLGWRKFKLTEQSLQIPFIVWDSHREGNFVNSTPVSGVDVTPTLLTYAGVRPPRQCNGRAVNKFVGNSDLDKDRKVLSVWHDKGSNGLVYSLRNHRYRYTTDLKQSTPESLHHELYDLRDDRKERTNLLFGNVKRTHENMANELKSEIVRIREEYKAT